jgi:hypothetical protein
MMYRSDLTDADIAAALWCLFEGMTGSSNTSAAQGVKVHEDSITGYLSTAETDICKFNTGNDTAFTPDPTTSMEIFSTQLNYSHPVSTSI